MTSTDTLQTLQAHLHHYPELAEAAAAWQFVPAADCLKEQTIVVTGAGDGIGRACARTLACFGANVVLLGRTRAKLEAVFDWIEQHTQTEPVIVPADLAQLDESAARQLADSITQAYGTLHGLINNASMLGPKVPIDHYPLADWQTTLQTNITAPFVLTQQLLPLLDQTARATVLNISSTVGRQGRAYWGAYAVSKFALEGFTQVLADERENAARIRVFSINPGGTRTSMRAAAYPLENPADVPPPEAHMGLFMFLLAGPLDHPHYPATGSALDARNWPP